jgi:ligand-binding sensor domain-containing protein
MLCLIAASAAWPSPEHAYRWRSFTHDDGLPSDKCYCIRVIEGEVWVGTDMGLAVYDGDSWRTYGPEDGLCHRVVMSIDYSEETGDIWIGTMGGANRYSGGRMDRFTQLNSGLANDVVYGVGCHGEDVWFATAAGASRYEGRTDEWSIFAEHNSPMHEIWNYGVAAEDPEHVYLAVWGGGVLEFDIGRQDWRVYSDPDGEMEIDLFPNDGPVHDITSAVSWSDGLLWVATYFGLSCYDGRHWQTFMEDDSGLASNFINFVRAFQGTAFMCTDRGLSVYDGDTWVTHAPGPSGGGRATLTDGTGRTTHRRTATGVASNFVLGVDLDGTDVWVATSAGVSVGRREAR